MEQELKGELRGLEITLAAQERLIQARHRASQGYTDQERFSTRMFSIRRLLDPRGREFDG